MLKIASKLAPWLLVLALATTSLFAYFLISVPLPQEPQAAGEAEYFRNVAGILLLVDVVLVFGYGLIIRAVTKDIDQIGNHYIESSKPSNTYRS
jgi:hypothetical protein